MPSEGGILGEKDVGKDNTAGSCRWVEFVSKPLGVHHETGLREAVCDGEVWKLRVTSAPHPDRVADYIGTALATRLAFCCCR